MLDRNIIKQDYQLINSKYKLNPNEIKFIMTVITQINKDDDDFKDYEFSVKELEEKFGSEFKNSRLKVFSKELMSKPFEIKELDGWSIYNWFSKIKYIEKESKFYVNLHKDLKPFLLDLKERFVTYNIQNILKLDSNYSIRIYQFLKEFEKIGKRTFVVKDLQDTLQVPNSFLEYSQLKRRVLIPTMKEINTQTDLDFWFEESKKIGKKVIEITFHIRTKKKKDTNLDTIENFIKYLKKEYINEVLIDYKDQLISLSEDGKLYNQKTLVNYTNKVSKEIFEYLYELAKDGKLLVLKQPKLF